jgi:hypothetical protein
MEKAEAKKRLEYLRVELQAQRISLEELHELQGLSKHIEPGDVELLEAAGVPEGEKRLTDEQYAELAKLLDDAGDLRNELWGKLSEIEKLIDCDIETDQIPDGCHDAEQARDWLQGIKDEDQDDDE